MSIFYRTVNEVIRQALGRCPRNFRISYNVLLFCNIAMAGKYLFVCLADGDKTHI